MIFELEVELPSLGAVKRILKEARGSLALRVSICGRILNIFKLKKKLFGNYECN